MRGVAALAPLFFFILFHTQREVQAAQANLPPRGWNSYDSFSWVISEEEFLQNADIVYKRLLNHGYEYVVVDYLWYRRRVNDSHADSLGFDVIDKWGRLIPDPVRWPSSIDGAGFAAIANKVHAMGLKFGIHVMRGISTQAVDANTPILDPFKGTTYTEGGREWRAQDIALTDRRCAWMPHGFMSVNTDLGAGRAFLRSLYQQYAHWGVDLVKHDCVFGDDLDLAEITVVSQALSELDRPMLHSLSPGKSATPAMAKQVSSLVNMYRVTGDDWDTWEDVAAHFDVSRDFGAAHMIGGTIFFARSWPDLDMLPLGWLTDPASDEGPYRACNLSLDEQKTQMTLWSMVKSPIFYGGDLMKLDDATYNIIANPTLLEIDAYSLNNVEFPYITAPIGLGINRRALTVRPRSPKEMVSLDTRVMDLTSCNDHKAKGWVSEFLEPDLERICWKYSTGSKYVPPFCLYKRKPLLTLTEEVLYQHKYHGKTHLFASDSSELCLDASPKRKLTAEVLKDTSFSPCRLDSNQMWELNNGTLLSSYSGLCATIKIVKAADPAATRSWVATGRNGEIYLSLFNLSPQRTVISTNLVDLSKVLPDRKVAPGSCTYSEVWTAKDLWDSKCDNISAGRKSRLCINSSQVCIAPDDQIILQCIFVAICLELEEACSFLYK